ncbi:MAG: NADH:ubiquinone reductase (Na(+)-transporting) subunit B [Cytophagia bacterium]|nr:MAG: NADH:ubiquinone reductase (Na(+)-transporting) subunit B [Cytophagia bacterium]TAG40523.1 MAG: NADH:ubiquinone reductase (Na(+)-transporting) subunit B [Cytophagia bacterium]TAH30995.1 MAG: NADH:ubiquinone reductase (Na(+)-transporting) subunit B [Cytophagales bacterium]
MKFLRNILDKVKPNFEKGGKFEKLHPAYDAFETFAFVPNHTTPAKGSQIRDGVDLKRMMVTVIVAMLPCLFFGMWNVGYQHHLATGAAPEMLTQLLIGAWVVLPVVAVSYAVGLGIEFYFAIRNGHSVNEGYLVSGMLIPLILPPTIPLWQVALCTGLAVLVAKEVFGGTGMNILNIAMTARAILYFAYPVSMAGSSVWAYLGKPFDLNAAIFGAKNLATVEGYSGATALGIVAEHSANLTKAKQAFEGQGVAILSKADDWSKTEVFSDWNMFMGWIPGSIGETSTLMCLIGAAILIFTGVGSWKIIVSAFAGTYLMAYLMNLLAINAFMGLPAHYHIVMGGVAFGIVFMATDPVTATHTETGKWIYGFLIGVLTVLIRVFNPAYPEGIMLAVLLMNVFAPLIDFYVIDANKQRRKKRLKYVTA